jgi:hypothetical protein
MYPFRQGHRQYVIDGADARQIGRRNSLTEMMKIPAGCPVGVFLSRAKLLSGLR